MANCILAFPVWSDVGVLHTPALSGGAWEADLPLTNLQDARLAKVARSTNALAASTCFEVDLGASRAVRVHSLWKHNLSSAGVARVRGMSAPAAFARENFADATDVGTPTRTADSYNANGIRLDLIGDDAAGTAEAKKWVLTWTGDAVKAIAFDVKKGTSTSTAVRLRDTTAVANRLLGVITWSGSVPTYTPTTGTLISTTLKADGVYRIVVATSSVTAANNNEWEVYPASDAALAVAGTGDVLISPPMTWNAATDQLVYDSGLSAGYPAGQTAEDVEGQNVGWVHVSSAAQSARYWRYNVLDLANTDGFVEIGRLYTCAGWQPTVNMVYGAGVGVTTATRGEESWGGAELFDVRTQRRVQRFTLEDEPEAEMMEKALRQMRIGGIHRDFFFVFDPADTYMHERAMPCRMATLSVLDMPFLARYSGAYELREVL